MKNYLVAFTFMGTIKTNIVDMDDMYFPSSDNMLGLKLKLKTCDAFRRRIFNDKGELVGSLLNSDTGEIIAVSCLNI